MKKFIKTLITLTFVFTFILSSNVFPTDTDNTANPTSNYPGFGDEEI